VSQVKQQSLQQLKEYQMTNLATAAVTQECVSRDDVRYHLKVGGMTSVFTVQFVKNNGELRTITGILVAPIEGPLGVNVTLMTDEGYKSFNTGAVVALGFSDGGLG
jgi:hypothetical protein